MRARLQRQFGRNMPRQAEAAGRVEQIVRPVIGHAGGERRDQIGLARGIASMPFVGGDEFGAERPAPCLLPDDIGLPLKADPGRERARVIGVELAVAGHRLRGQDSVARPEIGAAQRGAERLFLGAEHAPEGDRALRLDQIAVRPRRLDAHAFARRIAKLAGNRARRGAVDLDVDIDHVRVARRHRRDRDDRNQPGRDQCTPEIVDPRGIILLAGMEAGDRLQVARGKEGGGCRSARSCRTWHARRE